MISSSHVRGTIAFALTATLVSVAAAQPSGRTLHTRKQRLDIKVRVDKSRQKTVKPPAPSKRPALTADHMLRLGSKITKLDLAQIRALNGMIAASSRGARDLPDLNFRLGEKHARVTRHWRIRAIDLDLKIAASRSRNRKRVLRTRQKRLFETSRRHLVKAIAAYRNATKRKSYKRADEALFYLAFMLRQAKYKTPARHVLQQLIKDHPSSRFIPHAYMSFGDYFFDKRAFANAQKFYSKVLRFRRSPVYPLALFKTGWVYLNIQRDQKALESFYNVARLTRHNRRERTLFRAAKNSFVRAYAVIGRPARALAAFKRVHPASAFTMLESLARHYVDNGKNRKAVFTLRQLIRVAPRHKRVCHWQYQVVQAVLGVGTAKQKQSAVSDLVHLYSAYRKRNILPASNLAECRDDARVITNELARLWHKEARTTKAAATFARAAKLYRLYVANFPRAKHWAANQYWLAELLWQRAVDEQGRRRAAMRWREAAVAFGSVTRAGKVSKRRIKISAQATVLALENANRVDPRPHAKPTTSGGIASRPFTPRAKQMLTALATYLRYVKQAKDNTRVRVQFLRAQIYWRHNRFGKAIPVLESILTHHLNHSAAVFSANILMDILARTGRHAELVQWVDKLLGKSHRSFLAKHTELAENLRAIKRLSIRKEAKRLAQAGKFIECGDANRDAFNSAPKADDAHELLWNAGLCYEKGKSLGVAMQAFERLRTQFPKTVVAQRAIAKLGFILGKVAWYSAAAASYVEYANKFAGQPADKELQSADRALSTAVFYFRGIGDDKRAIRNTLNFIRRYGKRAPRRAADAFYSLHTIYAKQRNSRAQIRHWRRYLVRHAQHGGLDRQLIANVKLASLYWTSSCRVRGVLGACVRLVTRRKTRRGPKTHCGPDESTSQRVIARDPRLVRRARAHLAAALGLYKRGVLTKIPATGAARMARKALAIKHYAAAKFLLNEANYAAFLALAIPRGLRFDPANPRVAARSKQRFAQWLKKKERLMLVTAAAYHQVRHVKGGGAHYAIAAAARIGQMFQHFSASLFRAPVPRQLRVGRNTSERIHAYCSELSRVSIPLEERSVKAYGFCLRVSTQRGWFSHWSRACERRLGQIRPTQYPSKAELFAPARSSAPVVTTEAPALRLARR